MKKIIVALGLVLGLGGISATQAQMQVYNANWIKFGSINTAPTLSSGFEINMPNFLFKGNSAKFTIGGHSLELQCLTASTTSSAVSPNFDIIVDPVLPDPGLTIFGAKNNVAIGTASKPLNSVYSTKVYSFNGGVSSLSDRRYKTNIQDLSPALDKIMRLRPVKFDYLDEKDNPNSLDSNRMNRVGLIAQELAEVVPEAVQWLWPDDIYTIDYTTLIPFLIKSMQEQQVQIEALRSELQALKTAR